VAAVCGDARNVAPQLGPMVVDKQGIVAHGMAGENLCMPTETVAPSPKTRRVSTPATTVPWQNRIVGSGQEDPTVLVPNPSNWRTHPARQRDALRGSLDTVGWVQQIVVNRRSGLVVVDGHARIAEAIQRGESVVPVVYVDLSPKEEAQIVKERVAG
jgi:hypothetical protein